MIRLGRKEEIEGYFQSDAINQSFLKLLLSGVDGLKKDEKTLFYEEKGHFLIGNGVDKKITQGEKAYYDTFYVFEGKKPSDTIMSIVQQVFYKTYFDERPPTNPLEEYPSEILESCNEHKYSEKWKDETRVEKIITEGSSYFRELQLASGKEILSQIEENIINNIVMSLKTGEWTSKYFRDEKSIDIFYQVPIYFDYGGVRCKALLDMVIVNHNNKTVLPLDIKTIGDRVQNFPYNVKRNGYHIQGAFYTKGLLKLFNGMGESPIKELENLEGYKILPFQFLVETTTYNENKMTGEIQYNQGKALSFTLSKNMLHLGEYGSPKSIIDAHIIEEKGIYPILVSEKKGFFNAIELYRYYEQYGYDWDKEIIEVEGNLLIE